MDFRDISLKLVIHCDGLYINLNNSSPRQPRFEVHRQFTFPEQQQEIVDNHRIEVIPSAATSSCKSGAFRGSAKTSSE
ncbi:hypothetical protein GWI33_020762 [Rhynchophorus ferrugineus]|uniref:Uncharacterized protein n=1 Tax=Rhynchophorus ferrugineus TaxID=354439 RepID=A0A834M028_RHYFE|nr:hypothetical protein GWI33_020762 [Rhynchophorus ferrugineus]